MLLDHLTAQYWLTHHAKYRPQHVAIIFGETKLTYKQLNEQVNKLIKAFQKAGIRKGDKIATLLSNSIELLEVYWACAGMGAVAVPLSPLLQDAGLKNLLVNADTKLLITEKPNCRNLDDIINDVDQLQDSHVWIIDNEASNQRYASYQSLKEEQSIESPIVETVTGDDVYNIIYSSGTTGLPKGIVITHAVRAMYGCLFANAFRISPESIIMHSGSIIFNGSFLTLMPAMYLGCTYVLHHHFDPVTVLEDIKKNKVTHTILVPSQIISCLHYDAFSKTHLPSLEYILSVGAPLLLAHKTLLGDKLPDVFYELYGLTEGFMTILDKYDSLRKAGSVGRPPAFMQLKIVDDNGHELAVGSIGEIIGKGPLLMESYYKDEQQTATAIKDNWLYTGDIGYVDEDGFLFLTGRKKDLIISGGVNVYPSDIEEVCIKHKAVKDVAVFGVEHKEWGETPIAAIVLNTGDINTIAEADLKEWINKNITARFQKVADVIILHELPRNVAGKIIKTALRETYLSMQR
jgi:long-chain acyl-CoA synthetase